MRKGLSIGSLLIISSLCSAPLFATTFTISVGRDAPTTPGGQGIENLVFTPNTVTIGPTDTVVFQQDATLIGHNVVANDNSFSSGNIVSGTWTLTVGPFAAGTTRPFVCQAHAGEGMTGSIIVQTTPVKLQSFDVE